MRLLLAEDEKELSDAGTSDGKCRTGHSDGSISGKDLGL